MPSDDIALVPPAPVVQGAAASLPIFAYAVGPTPNPLNAGATGTVTIVIAYNGAGSVNCNGFTVQMTCSNPAAAADLVSADPPLSCASVSCSDNSGWSVALQSDNAFLFTPSQSPYSFTSQWLTLTFSNIPISTATGNAILYISEWAAVSPATAPSPSGSGSPICTKLYTRKFPATFSISLFTATPLSVAYGGTTTLSWYTSGAILQITYVAADGTTTTLPAPGGNALPANGTQDITLTASTTFTLQGQDGTGGYITQRTTYVSVSNQPVSIDSFSGVLQSNGAGGIEVLLTWTTTGALNCLVAGETTPQYNNGSYAVPVNPGSDFSSFTLTAYGAGKETATQSFSGISAALPAGCIPWGIASNLDSAGNTWLYINDANTGLVQFLELNSLANPLPDTSCPCGTTPSGIAVSQDGSVLGVIDASASAASVTLYGTPFTSSLTSLSLMSNGQSQAYPLQIQNTLPECSPPQIVALTQSLDQTQSVAGGTLVLQGCIADFNPAPQFAYTPDFILRAYNDDGGSWLSAIEIDSGYTWTLPEGTAGSSTACVVADTTNNYIYYGDGVGHLYCLSITEPTENEPNATANGDIATNVNIRDMVIFSDYSGLVIRTDTNSLLSFTLSGGNFTATTTTYTTSANPGQLCAIPGTHNVALTNPGEASFTLYSF